jgi:hypothetical protein
MMSAGPIRVIHFEEHGPGHVVVFEFDSLRPLLNPGARGKFHFRRLVAESTVGLTTATFMNEVANPTETLDTVVRREVS